MLQCTSAEANKILKKLNEKLDFAQLQLDAANTFLTMLIVTSLISAITVSIKALGKNFAIKKSNDIVFFFARLICFIIPEKVFSGK